MMAKLNPISSSPESETVASLSATPLGVDAKSAFLLSAIFGLAGAVTVSGLLPALPVEARTMPLPLPLFCALLFLQSTVVYGLLGLAGCRLSGRSGREPSAHLTRLWSPLPETSGQERVVFCFVLGLACGCVLVCVVTGIRHWLPQTFPAILHPANPAVAFSASIAGAFGEEILYRLFLLSLLLHFFQRWKGGIVLSVGLSTLLFSAAHAPAWVFLFSGLAHVPPIAWLWLIALNGLCGLACGTVFLRWGILSAISLHLGTDAIWHVATQFF